jgi:hypothetical protein
MLSCLNCVRDEMMPAFPAWQRGPLEANATALLSDELIRWTRFLDRTKIFIT